MLGQCTIEEICRQYIIDIRGIWEQMSVKVIKRYWKVKGAVSIMMLRLHVLQQKRKELDKYE